MALKWKKDGTAKCGPFNVSVGGEITGWWWAATAARDADEWEGSGHAKTEAAAKLAASKWLRIQAASMLRDLKKEPDHA